MELRDEIKINKTSYFWQTMLWAVQSISAILISYLEAYLSAKSDQSLAIPLQWPHLVMRRYAIIANVVLYNIKLQSTKCWQTIFPIGKITYRWT